MKKPYYSQLIAVCLALLVTVIPSSAQSDPFLWLETNSNQTIQWADQHTDQAIKQYGSDKLYHSLVKDFSSVLNSKERIVDPIIVGDKVFNYWRDARHHLGIFRWASFNDFIRNQPRWESLIDFDKLTKSTAQIYRGASFEPTQQKLALITISPGGSDAHNIREFDLQTKKFIEQPAFDEPKGKGWAMYRSPDSILYANSNKGTTNAGYPHQIFLWDRTQQKSTPISIPTDSSQVGTWVQRFFKPNKQYTDIALVYTSYTNCKKYLLDDLSNPIELNLPEDASIQTLHNNQLVFKIRQNWSTQYGSFTSGSLLSQTLTPEGLSGPIYPVWIPTNRSAVISTNTTASALILVVSEKMQRKQLAFYFQPNGWTGRPISQNRSGMIKTMSSSVDQSTIINTYEDFLTPSSSWAVNTNNAQWRKIQQLPSFFKEQKYKFSWNTTQSKDGTEVYYALVEPKNAQGPQPLLLTGYGGFEYVLEPKYLDYLGKVWLDRGGSYAIAYIRGGGEFGPDWHKAATGMNKHKSFEDFNAIAEDLIRTNKTSPNLLASKGGSNGGLLVAASALLRPDLYRAVLSEVPVLDLHRFHKLLAGSSWLEEYGNPEDPAVSDYWDKYSPYDIVQPHKNYPKFFFTSNTKDDRVHPGHARKMVAKLESMGYKPLYFEDAEGGHTGAPRSASKAHITSVEFAFLLKTLMP